MANVEFFERAVSCKNLTPIRIIGEATFHQFHGGVTTCPRYKTNDSINMRKEYLELKNLDYSFYHTPLFYPDKTDIIIKRAKQKTLSKRIFIKKT